MNRDLGEFNQVLGRWVCARWRSGKEFTCQSRSCVFDPWVKKIPQRRKRLPVFSPGEFHGQRSLVGCSACGYRKLNMNEHADTHPCMYFSKQGMSQVAKMEMSRGIQEISIW